MGALSAPGRTAAAPAPIVLVVAGDERVRRMACRLLGEGGFAPIADAQPAGALRPRALGGAGLVALLSPAPAADRVGAIRELAAGAEVAVLAAMPASTPSGMLRKALQAGAAGIVLDDALEQALVPSAWAVAAGQLAVPASMRRQVARRALTHREKQVLALVLVGSTNRQIADRLYLAESTVKTHLSSAFEKLDARSRAEAASLILDPDEGPALGVLAVADAERLVAR
jgi:DNA-binding NarL/FixJ family response regulator